MKKILGLLLCLALLFSFAACGGEYPVQGGGKENTFSPSTLELPEESE